MARSAKKEVNFDLDAVCAEIMAYAENMPNKEAFKTFHNGITDGCSNAVRILRAAVPTKQEPVTEDGAENQV